MQTIFNRSRRLVGATLMAGAALVLASCGGGDKSAAVTSDDMSMGNPNAKVTVIEYASVTCTHCAAFNETVLPQLEEKYIKPGKINYVYREFLTPPVDVSAAGTLLARCAGKDKYFKVIDAVMRQQKAMFADGTSANAKPVLLGIAKSVGMSEEAFNRCISDPEAQQALQDRVNKYSKEFNIDSTPTFFINGKKLERKTGDISDFDKAFAELGVK